MQVCTLGLVKPHSPHRKSEPGWVLPCPQFHRQHIPPIGPSNCPQLRFLFGEEARVLRPPYSLSSASRWGFSLQLGWLRSNWLKGCKCCQFDSVLLLLPEAIGGQDCSVCKPQHGRVQTHTSTSGRRPSGILEGRRCTKVQVAAAFPTSLAWSPLNISSEGLLPESR